MNRLLLLLMSCVPVATQADTLQFEVGRGGAFASYAHVEVWTMQGQRVYEGTADGYGRISAPLAAGDYRVSVTTRAGAKSSNVHLTGGNVLHAVTL